MIIRLLMILTFSMFLSSCSRPISVNDMNAFTNATGIIGVFRQPIGFCSGGYSQWITVNDTKIFVKPTWTSRQDNLFSKSLEPGKASIETYSFGCGNTITTINLSKEKGSKKYPTLIVPKKGFCKVVISLMKGDPFFSKNDELLEEFFDKEKIEAIASEIPYCEIENLGS